MKSDVAQNGRAIERLQTDMDELREVAMELKLEVRAALAKVSVVAAVGSILGGSLVSWALRAITSH